MTQEGDAAAARDWFEFTDPAEPAQRFRCDLTWLTSAYACVFGAGCRGVETARPDAGCCTLGAHFTDADDLARVGAAVAALTPAQWERHDVGTATGWNEEAQETQDVDAAGNAADGEGTGATAAARSPEMKTRVVDGVCILFNRPGFPGGTGCALHLRAVAAGVEPLTLKPDVCWQLPLRRSYRDVTLPDGDTHLETTIGEYDRASWGPGGHDLDWYCTGSPTAHTASAPLYASAAAELRELMGGQAYRVLAHRCAAGTVTTHPATLAARATGAGGGLGPAEPGAAQGSDEPRTAGRP